MRLQSLIEDTLGEVEFRLHDPRNMRDADMLWADLVVFSGGWGRSIVRNPDTFNRMVEFCVKHQKPTIGICLGAEAIAAYFGSQLRELPIRRVGNVRIHFESDIDGMIDLSPSVMVYEFHKWVIDAVHSPIINLAKSKDGCELFKHETLPIWGLQFHPEVERLDSKGHLIFANIVAQLGLAKALV
jgi:GMP synthase (glutamine-hydrolysing)